MKKDNARIVTDDFILRPWDEEDAEGLVFIAKPHAVVWQSKSSVTNTSYSPICNGWANLYPLSRLL